MKGNLEHVRPVTPLCYGPGQLYGTRRVVIQDNDLGLPIDLQAPACTNDFPTLLDRYYLRKMQALGTVCMPVQRHFTSQKGKNIAKPALSHSRVTRQGLTD